MPAAPVKGEVRLSANDYTKRQRWMTAMWLFDWLAKPPFSGRYEGEARYYMPRLLLGVCVAHLAERPLTMRAAFVAMDANHGKTAAKYVEQAEEERWIERSFDPNDKRKVVLVPTGELLKWFDMEMAGLIDDCRNLIGALARDADDCTLPDTGAAKFRVQGKISDDNRHRRRAMEVLSSRDRYLQPRTSFASELVHWLRPGANG
jgi:hypothetical protein